MCDYSLHAVASRPAKVGETLITTTFPRTSTRGFAAESEPGMAVCLLPGTELAFEQTLSTTRDGSGREQPASALPSLVWSNQMCRIAITTRSNFPMEAMSW